MILVSFTMKHTVRQQSNFGITDPVSPTQKERLALLPLNSVVDLQYCTRRILDSVQRRETPGFQYFYLQYLFVAGFISEFSHTKKQYDETLAIWLTVFAAILYFSFRRRHT